MRRLFLAAFFALGLALPALPAFELPAQAQQARVVTACGYLAPFGPDAVGGVAFPTIDTTGKLCLSGGGGGGSLVGGTTPVTGTCPSGQFLYNNAGVLGCSASSTSIVLPQTVSGTVNSGGVPYFNSTTQMSSSALLAANALMVGGGAGVAPSTITTGAGVPAVLGIAPNTNGGFATAKAPLTAGGTGSLSGAFGYYICTGVCTITLPTPAAGFQFCVRNGNGVTTVITIAAIASVQFEKTTYATYGTAGTGTMVSGGAAGDKICLIGLDATHYLVGAFVGTWTNS